MAKFKIEASWNYAAEGGRVDYSFMRREQMTDERHAQQVAHAIALGRNPDVSRNVWRDLGDDQGPMCTALEADAFAMAWLTANAGFDDNTDSFYMHLFADGLTERIDAVAAAAGQR